VFENESVKGSEFLRKAKVVAKRRKLTFRWMPERGSGSHGTLYLGDRFTLVTICASSSIFARRISECSLLSIPQASFARTAAGGVHVRFPDLPEALTGGDDLADTRVQAADCLAEAIAGRIRRGDEIPPPSKPKRGQHPIGLPLYLAPKLALYLGMRELGMRNTELARRLGVSETVVRRMFDPRHNTKPEKIETALAALGKRIVVSFEDAA
jgi:antitoxin HicB